MRLRSTIQQKGSCMGSIGRYLPSARTQFILGFALAVILASVHSAHAQASTPNVDPGEHAALQVHPGRSFHVGVFFTGGFVPNYWVHGGLVRRSVELNFFNAGLSAGKIITSAHGRGVLRGQGEAAFELMPFWLGDYPKQTQSYCMPGEGCAFTFWGPYRSYGMSITPLLFRWDFTEDGARRVLPWAQLGGGLLWTNHRFPLLGLSDGVINFTPQVGVGESLFVHGNRSLDFAFKAVHISNAGLGDNNPGLNVTLQFSVGYSWWR